MDIFEGLIAAGLENSTRPLVFTSASGCRASENYVSSEFCIFPYMSILFVMQGKCLSSDISRPVAGLFSSYVVIEMVHLSTPVIVTCASCFFYS